MTFTELSDAIDRATDDRDALESKLAELEGSIAAAEDVADRLEEELNDVEDALAVGRAALAAGRAELDMVDANLAKMDAELGNMAEDELAAGVEPNEDKPDDDEEDDTGSIQDRVDILAAELIAALDTLEDYADNIRLLVGFAYKDGNGGAYMAEGSDELRFV